jgi:hypothetical protein
MVVSEPATRAEGAVIQHEGELVEIRVVLVANRGVVGVDQVAKGLDEKMCRIRGLTRGLIVESGGAETSPGPETLE